ncbi:MAG: response regulator transcription factor [Schleiferiaceae bacterium]|nr:response regulator transcription factor [Schleiferiaceae bacterium]
MKEKLQAIIIDDEAIAGESLELLIQRHTPDITVLEVFQSGELAKTYLDEHPIDLVFLDIEMPRMNGFQFLEQWDAPPFEVIFTTAYDEFAVSAFRVSAFDYLLKPIDKEVLIESVQRLINAKTTGMTKEQLLFLREMLNQRDRQDQRVPIPVNDGVLFECVSNIIRCEGDAGYTRIFIKGEPTVMLSKTLKEVEHQYFKDCGFVRVHQSHLVNPLYLKKYIKKDGGYLVLMDGTTVPVSRRKKDDFLGHFKNQS